MPEQIKNALRMTRPMGGATCTGEALQYAADVMLQEERGKSCSWTLIIPLCWL